MSGAAGEGDTAEEGVGVDQDAVAPTNANPEVAGSPSAMSPAVMSVPKKTMRDWTISFMVSLRPHDAGSGSECDEAKKCVRSAGDARRRQRAPTTGP